MTPWNDYAMTVIVQVSAISGAAVAFAACSRSSAARRQAVGVVGLSLVLGNPLLVLLLPKVEWWRSAISGSATGSPNASTPHEPLRLASAEFEPPSAENRTAVDVETKALRNQAPLRPAFDRVEDPTRIPSSQTPAPISADAGNAAPRPGNGWRLAVCVAGCTWLAGSILSASLWMRRSHRLRRLVRLLDLAPRRAPRGSGVCFDLANVRFAAIAQDVCDAVGLRRLPPIAFSDALPMPLVLGVFRPTIVIPGQLLQAGAETRLRDVLIHEAAHVARRDAWINLAQRLAAVLWWWHPGVLAMNRVITRSREEVCDNYVLHRSEASQYANTLLELAERCAQMGRVVPTLGCSCLPLSGKN